MSNEEIRLALLRLCRPVGDDRIAGLIDDWYREWEEWALSLTLSQWESLRRVGEEEREWGNYADAIEKHMKNAAERDQTGRKWGKVEGRSSLRDALVTATQLDGSNAAAAFTRISRGLGQAEQAELTAETQRRLAQEFMTGLVTRIRAEKRKRGQE